MEAAGHELPVITSNLEVIREKITNNKTGLLCNNLGEFEKAINQLKSKKERARISSKAFSIAEKFDMNKVIKQLIKVFEKVLEHPN
jgi:glycosyltransferase involved in cell wall biosynthesis